PSGAISRAPGALAQVLERRGGSANSSSTSTPSPTHTLASDNIVVLPSPASIFCHVLSASPPRFAASVAVKPATHRSRFTLRLTSMTKPSTFNRRRLFMRHTVRPRTRPMRQITPTVWVPGDGNGNGNGLHTLAHRFPRVPCLEAYFGRFA